MSNRIFLLIVVALAGALSSCNRSGNEVWEDTQTAQRHMYRGMRSLGGKHGDSRAVCAREEFMPQDNYMSESDYIPITDVYNENPSMGDYRAPQPRDIPGDPNSALPGIEAFKDPAMDPQLAAVFRTIHFAYNSNLVQDDEDLSTIRKIAQYLKRHPQTYLFVAGHCDERGPDAYNLTLGAKRANSVRNLLINEGANPDRVFTISYGKERPVIFEHHDEAWAQNRRAEFRVYQR
ncbi:putative peptidoglycan-associated lipoprotein (Pal) [Chlamydiales bacterium STE3]|nr:putative peptidoglycan-associated lipoprotein (Pal) [Chlamydiales bacterium STE3]